MIASQHANNGPRRVWFKTDKQCLIAFFAGFASFLPVGMTYLSLMILGLSMLPNLWRRIDMSSIYAKLWWAVGIYAACAAVSAIFTVASEQWLATSSSRLFHLLRTPVLIAMGLLLLPTERQATLQGFLCGALACAAIYLVNEVSPLPDFILWHNMLSVTGNASSQKMLLLACAAAVFFSGSRSSHSTSDLLLATGLTFIVLAIGVSRNAHILTLSLPLIVVGFTTKKLRHFVLAGITAASLFGLAYIASSTFSTRIDTALSEVISYTNTGGCDGSVSVRLAMTKAALDEFLASPLVGTGLGSWQGIWPNHSTACPSLAGVNNPHNDYALAAMETGVIGLAALVWLFAQLFRASALQARQGLVPLIFVMSLAISCLVNAPLRDATLGMAIIWLCTATLGLRGEQKSTPKPQG